MASQAWVDDPRAAKKYGNLLFVYNLVRNHIKNPEILKQFKFYLPSRDMRHYPLFHIDMHHTLYGKNNCVDRMCSLANRYCNRIDFFATSISNCKFRNSVLQILDD